MAGTTHSHFSLLTTAEALSFIILKRLTQVYTHTVIKTSVSGEEKGGGYVRKGDKSQVAAQERWN